MDVVKSMKIIIADAKSLKEKHFPIEKQTPLFFNKAESLRKQLKELESQLRCVTKKDADDAQEGGHYEII